MANRASERVPTIPSYVDNLNAEERKNYSEKLKIINNINPYSAGSNFFSESMEMWPDIEFPDIVAYLLCSTSRFTKEQIKAYRSLESYQYFVAGWVRCVFVGKATSQTKILIGKVSILTCFQLFLTFILVILFIAGLPSG